MADMCGVRKAVDCRLAQSINSRPTQALGSPWDGGGGDFLLTLWPAQYLSSGELSLTSSVPRATFMHLASPTIMLLDSPTFMLLATDTINWVDSDGSSCSTAAFV